MNEPRLAKSFTPGEIEVHSIFRTIQGEGPQAGTPAVFVRLADCNLKCFFCDTEFERKRTMSSLNLTDAVVELAIQSGARLVVFTGGEPLLQNLSGVFNMLLDRGYKIAIETAGTLCPEWLQSVTAVDRQSINLTISPKTSKVSPTLVAIFQRIAWKYIVNVGDPVEWLQDYEVDKDGLPSRSTQAKGAAAILDPAQRPMTRSRLSRPWDFDDLDLAVGSDAYYSRLPKLIEKHRDSIFVQPCDVPGIYAAKMNEAIAAAIAIRYGYRLSYQVHKAIDLP